MAIPRDCSFGVAGQTTVQIDTLAPAPTSSTPFVDNGGAAGPIDSPHLGTRHLLQPGRWFDSRIADVLIEADGGFATTNLTVADGMVFNAESFTQENANAGGTTTFGGLITLADSDPAAAAPQDADFTFTGVNLLLKAVGNNDIEDLMTVTNSGTFTTETNVALVVDTFTQNGTGSNVIGGDITADLMALVDS